MRKFLTSLLPANSGRLRWLGLGLMAFALLVSLMALSAFAAQSSQADGWLPYLFSTLCFAVGCYLITPRTRPAVVPERLTRLVLIVAGVILLLAIGLRVYQLENIPYGTWVDEAENGLSVMQILNDSSFRPVFVDANNPPAHLFYLIAIAYKLFGPSTFSSRLVIAAFGIGSVALAFLAGREAHGNRFGLIFAFLMAVAHWALTLSRIALHGMTTPFFVLLTAYLLLRGKRTGKLFDFALAGLAVGFGLCFYTAYRTFLPVIALFLIYWAFVTWREGRKAETTRATLRQMLLNLVAFAIAAGLAVAPVAQYALLRPVEFWSRSNQVSIFNDHQGDDLRDTLIRNTTKHVLMFNQHGDNNGRHNLPGEPMLDPLMAALFLAGLALAIVRPNNAARLLFLVSIPLGLLGGILSLDFEAPQSLRSIAVMPGVFYMTALAVETIWRGLEQSRVGRAIVLGLVAVGAGFLVYYNTQLYFVRQANNSGSWEAHNTVETLVARRMQVLQPQGYTFYASMYFNQHTVIRFLTPQVTRSEWIIPPNIFPIHEPGDQPVALFVDQTNSWIVQEALRYYPNAEVDTDTNPEGTTVLYTVLIPAADIANIQGLTARYWVGETTDTAPALVRTEPTLETDWSTGAPLAMPFVAEWSGVVFAPRYGDYQIVMQSPGRATVWLDDRTILENQGEQSVTLTVAQGTHDLRVQAEGGPGLVRLQWLIPSANELVRPMEENTSPSVLETIGSKWLYRTPPVMDNGLLGTYYENDTWSGAPAFERVDPFINTYFHIIPLPQRPYSINWDGEIDAPVDGEYGFSLNVNGSAQLLIDGQVVVDAMITNGMVDGAVTLTAGRHPIRVHYLDNVGGSRIELYWRPPGGDGRVIVPSTQLWPATAP